MARFRLGQDPYIALVRQEEVKTTPDDPVHLAVYAPGTPCIYAVDHQQEPASLSYGFLVWAYDGWGFAGPDCLQNHFGCTDPQPWKTALDRRHPLIGTGLGDDWRSQTKRIYWRLVPLMGLMLQVEPEKDILRGYLKRVTRGKRSFTPREKETLLNILRERGGTFRAPSQDGAAWGRELKEHRKVLKARRDFAFRLARLATLDLDAEDMSTVRSLQAYNTSWKNGRMKRLTEPQVRLLLALEAQYNEERERAAEEAARELARRFRLQPPRW